MFERVMRRFGVTNQYSDRQPTYFEELLPKILPRVQTILSQSPDSSPLTLVAQEIVCLESEANSAPAPDFESETVIEAALAFLSLVSDNDFLPPSCQLVQNEISMTWRLLYSYAMGDENTSNHFEEVLALLEDKFHGGMYPQAALLLRLFETTEARRRNNERTLFYEDMIGRFGAQRVNGLSKHVCKRYHQKLSACEDPVELLFVATKWLSTHAQMNFHIPYRSPQEVADWNRMLSDVTDESMRHSVLAMIPPRRLRNLCDFESIELAKRFREHLTRETLTAYASQLLKCCYFIVLVTGRTGYEPFIRDFFEWVQRHFGFSGTRLLPELHRRTTVGEEALEATVKNICKAKLGEPLHDLLARLDDSRIDSALTALADDFAELDPNDLPPGSYELYGLLLNKITDLTSHDPTLLFRIHRLC